MRISVYRTEAHRLGKLIYRLGKLMHLDKDFTDLGVGHGLVGFDGQRKPELLQCFLLQSLFVQSEAQTVVRLVVSGLLGNHLAILLCRLVEFPLQLKSVAQIQSHLGKVRTSGDRLPAVHFLILWIAHPIRPYRHVSQGVGVIGINTQGLFQALVCKGHIARILGLHQGIGGMRESHGPGGIIGQRALIILFCDVEFALHHIGNAQS